MLGIDDDDDGMLPWDGEADSWLRSTLRPFKRYDVVDAWISQYALVCRRYKFLVLQGPSQVGKTLFARNLSTPCFHGMLEVNCASRDEPDLRAYRLRQHGLILFDDIVPQQVVSQRQLFQADCARVQMGRSAIHMNSYEVCMWRTKIVLVSSDWDVHVSQLSAADQHWVNTNSFVLCVTEPMWIA